MADSGNKRVIDISRSDLLHRHSSLSANNSGCQSDCHRHVAGDRQCWFLHPIHGRCEHDICRYSLRKNVRTVVWTCSTNTSEWCAENDRSNVLSNWTRVAELWFIGRDYSSRRSGYDRSSVRSKWVLSTADEKNRTKWAIINIRRTIESKVLLLSEEMKSDSFHSAQSDSLISERSRQVHCSCSCCCRSGGKNNH